MKIYLVIFVFILSSNWCHSQSELFPWSNINGIRIDGELLELNSSLGLIGKDWSSVRKTAKERAAYSYERQQNIQYTPVRIDSFFFEQSVEDLGAGNAEIRIRFQSEKDTSMIGAFFILDLPSEAYTNGQLKLLDPEYQSLSFPLPHPADEILSGRSQGISIRSDVRNLNIRVSRATEILVRSDSSNDFIQIYFALMTGKMLKGASTYQTIQIDGEAVPDRAAATLTLDPTNLGRHFKGFGGNFRLQNPTTDPPVIDYCLDNLQVRWGRVEMPWRFWQEFEEQDPIKVTKEKGLHPRVEMAMRMAQRLDSLQIPVILSDWSAPDWAIEGKMSFGPQPGGLRGNPLDRSKMDKIYQSIGDYIQYAKDYYGFEFAMFSFNESDLGINVRQSPQEHAAFIKGLGAHLKTRGLKTKLLLGDTADANGWPFATTAMNDETTHPFLGAVSFHSWRGYTDENLQAWYQIAETLNLPLLVGEGSMDAGAWRYPDIFSESAYAMEEINLYLRLLRICQPESILQWQLTADYSPLKGGGVFGNHEIPLQPTQRFWNFKQLANVPQSLQFMPVKTDCPRFECSGLADPDRNIYVVHLVNNGASRTVKVKGLPPEISWIKIWVTNAHTSNAQRRMIRIRDGLGEFTAESNSFITLIADGESPF
ncbi:MAG: hypothetical protein KDC53_07980 [Saprospiraceae bacterium]|nr:hypothetical protein [Saprospiraceae bacterium]